MGRPDPFQDQRRGLTAAQLRGQVADLARAAADDAALVTAAQPDRVAAVTAELAHRQGLPARARRAADAERRLQHHDTLASPGMRLAAIASSPIRSTGEAAGRWQTLADQIDPRLAADDTWPDLADAIDRVHAAGTDPARLLPRLTGPDDPLPDTHPARTLRHRLIAAHPAAVNPARTWAVNPAATTDHTGYDHARRHDYGPTGRGPGLGR